MSAPSSLDNLPPLREVIAQYDLRARKSLGQNFLMDPQITDNIARAAGDLSGKTVIEVGPGPGGLTRSLLRTGAAQVIAIEFDPRAVEALQGLQAAAGERLQILADDALKLDWRKFLDDWGGNAVIVANLPYNISTVLLAGWLQLIAESPGLINRMVLMFQREVAARLLARPRTPDYGRLSVLTQWLCQVEHVMTLPPGAFVPSPKVHSSVLRFDPLTRVSGGPAWSAMDTVLTQAFAQRRKMLRGNLRDMLDILAVLGIDSARRAEELSVADYTALAVAWAARDISNS